MDFFEPPPRRPQPPQPPRYRQPEWRGPPENVAPALTPLDLVLVNTGEQLRFGLRFADGRKATNVGGPVAWDAGEPPADGALLVGRGGSGGERRWDQRLWAWPLPPAGELLFACEWPAQEIALTTLALDAEAILSAAARACVLWPAPDLPERPAPGRED